MNMLQSSGKKRAHPFTVTIAEKPSVAKDLAAYMANQQGGRSTYEQGMGYRLPNGDMVTYTVGHLIEMEMPDAYLTPEQDKADPLTYLPLFPGEYKFRPRSKRDEKSGKIVMKDGVPVPDPLFKVVERLLKEADVVINAGDQGREGQLIMDELFRFIGLDPASPHIKRIDPVDLNPKGIAEAFARMTPNADRRWSGSGAAGRCRQEADFEVGINASRAYWSLTGDWRVALGRIKTVVLNMISKRCMEIEMFKPEKYFVPVVTLDDGTELRWKCRPGAEGTPGFDMNGRLTSKELAEAMVARINAGLEGKILNVTSKDLNVKPPKPFSLASLQSEGSKRLGESVEAITKAAQSLYEKHKMITYVGVECQYLPESMLKEARTIMANLSPMFNKVMSGANSSMTPKSFNDAKLDEHHAIAPTGTLGSNLTDTEKGVFEMVARRFAAQFYPDYTYRSLGLDAEFGQDQFEARTQKTLRMGWKEAEGYTEAEVDDEASSNPDALVEAERDREAETPDDNEVGV
jgi:DNA topoisomerase-3